MVRLAKRLGAQEAVLIFRFDKAHMEAHPYEGKEAFAEGGAGAVASSFSSVQKASSASMKAARNAGPPDAVFTDKRDAQRTFGELT